MRQAPPASPAQIPPGLVPVNVYVLDRSGKPVTDLKPADFTVTEDGVPQQVRHFALQALTPDASSPAEGLTLRKGATWSPQNRRVFVIVLGMGRLEEPSGYLSGLLRFVKTRLLPQDQVALFAHGRAISFTADHERIIAALERVKKSHEDIDFQLSLQLGETGMAGLYGSRVIPRKLQTRIDEMVLGPGAKPANPTPAEAIEHEGFGQMSLDDFVASSATTLKDQENLMALMEYLRRFDGEKHVLFVTEKGLLWPSAENDRALASAANDARAAIHTLQAGGTLSAESGREMNATVQQAMSFRSLRAIAELTGGVAAISEKGQAVLDKVDETTRTGYLLGYRPSNSVWDSSYRNIAVKVNRPDATVLFRHGYFRVEEIGTFDRRGFMTNGRLGAAVMFRREIDDLKVKASAALRGGNLAVEGKIEVSKVKVTTVGGARVGLLNVAVFCFDSGGQPVGTHVQTMPLELSEQEYARVVKSGLPYIVQFPNIRGTQNIRFVVYDFGSDLVGRVDIKVF
jgi:VWFA-related protein